MDGNKYVNEIALKLVPRLISQGQGHRGFLMVSQESQVHMKKSISIICSHLPRNCIKLHAVTYMQ
jgi:hypothetical protein